MTLNNDSRTVNASKNVSSALINKLIILCLTFISRKIFIRYIGVEYLGINGLFANVLTLLSMADLGIETAMNVSLYKPIAENNLKRISALLNYFRKVYYVIAVAVLGLGLILIPFLKYIVNLDQEIPNLYLFYVIFVIKNCVSYLFVYKSAIIRADQKSYVVNRVDIIVNICKVAFQVLSITLYKSYLVYILLEAVAVIIHNICVSIIADRNYRFIKNRENLDQNEKRLIFQDTSSVFLYKVSRSLIIGTDNILLSVLFGTVSVGLYSNYHTVTHTLITFVTLLFTSLTASVGNLVATKSSDQRYKVFDCMQMISFWLCGILSISLFFLIQDFIVIWLGEKMLMDDATMIAIVINVFFSCCMRPVWTFREGTGMYRQIRFIMLVTAALNLILSIVLGKLIGISGVFFATSISKLSTYFWYEPQILFRDFFAKPIKKYYMNYLNNFILMLIIVACLYMPMKLIDGTHIVTWLLKAVICFVVINFVYWIRYRKTEQFDDFKKRILSMKNRLFSKRMSAH